MKARLEAHGINVVGVTDHGFVKSIYFFDPNGIRLEFTAETVGQDELKEYLATRTQRWRPGPRTRPLRPGSPPRPDVLLRFEARHLRRAPPRVL